MMTDQWIPVEDKLPEIGKPVLAYFSSGNMDTSRRERTGWSYESIYGDVLHWQPLPEPPAGGKI